MHDVDPDLSPPQTYSQEACTIHDSCTASLYLAPTTAGGQKFNTSCITRQCLWCMLPYEGT